MFCETCDNFLGKEYVDGILRCKCTQCGRLYDIGTNNNIVYDDAKKTPKIQKTGKAIFHYASNQKQIGDCPGCKKKGILIAWEIIDKARTKIYGCACDHSWIIT